MLKILQYGSPILEKPAKKVEKFDDPRITKLIEEMLVVLEKERDHSAGLSAPQVGQPLRIAICRRMDLEEELRKKAEEQDSDSNSATTFRKKTEPIWEIMINPEIISKSEQKSIKWEGCLSVSHGEIFAEVERPKVIKVKFTNVKGEEEVVEARDYFSHIVQHEIDHLDGVLFLKYVKDPSKLFSREEIEDF